MYEVLIINYDTKRESGFERRLYDMAMNICVYNVLSDDVH